MNAAKPVWHRVTEQNDWEGETWHHYFQDGEGVLDILELVVAAYGENLSLEVETETLTWDKALVLANLDDGDYMEPHWFGRLTEPNKLIAATEQDLYKGGIRKYGEELFTRGTDCAGAP